VDPRIERLYRLAAGRAGAAVLLGGGLPSAALFPRARLQAAFLRALAQPAGALQYGWPEGHERLRAWIAARVAARGARVTADDVIVTNGAQQAIDLAVSTLGAAGALGDGGWRIGVDAETYPAALDLFRTRGALPVVGAAVRCRYVMPHVSNPRGLALDDAARAQLLASGAALIEDDAYAELNFSGPPGRPLAADAPDRVFHVGTFSKVLCPGLRVGWLIAPRDAREEALRRKRDLDLQASSLAQSILVEFLDADDFDARLARARAYYRRRAVRLARALRRRLPAWRFRMPDGGFSIWCETGEPGDDIALLEAAVAEGVTADPGRLFRADDASAPVALRLCFSSAPVAALDDGVARVARAWDTWRRARDRERVVERSML
jgi:2-aminoadipate transaminase